MHFHCKRNGERRPSNNSSLQINHEFIRKVSVNAPPDNNVDCRIESRLVHSLQCYFRIRRQFRHSIALQDDASMSRYCSAATISRDADNIIIVNIPLRGNAMQRMSDSLGCRSSFSFHVYLPLQHRNNQSSVINCDFKGVAIRYVPTWNGQHFDVFIIASPIRQYDRAGYN